ncbi:MAG: hypothetical protein IPK84_00990 [Candidatus Moraniibacteriota bacterium]|nr:MAG: hypothetical protein IPK84_00990 [Candidatus Moranbacteria bacterium]
MNPNLSTIIIILSLGSTAILLGYMLYTTKKSTEKEKNNIMLQLEGIKDQFEQSRAALNTANSLLERDPTTHYLNKRGLTTHLIQRVLFGQEVPASPSTIISTTIISIHLRYRGMYELESGCQNRILTTLLCILQENFPNEIATIGHFNDGNAVNKCIEKIYIVCRQISSASDRARTAIGQFELNPTCPPRDTISIAAVMSTFNTKSYAIWRVLKKFRDEPQTAETFVLDILERLEHLSGQADDWTIQQITAEPNQTAITTKI